MPALFARCRVSPGWSARDLREPRDLELGERRVGIRGGEVAHQPDDVGARDRRLAEPPPPHARVDLHVDRDSNRERPVRHGQLEPCLAGLAVLVLERGAEHHDPRRGERRPQVDALTDGRDAQGRGALLEGRGSDRERTVPVGVRLDDRPELGRPERVAQAREVRPQRGPVDRDHRSLVRLRPCGDHRRLRGRSRGERRPDPSAEPTGGLAGGVPVEPA